MANREEGAAVPNQMQGQEQPQHQHAVRQRHIQRARREEGAAVPNQMKGQEQPQHQNAVRQRHIHLKWSNFKPEFSGKPEEDEETHLLCLNDWMEAHCFDEDIKVQRFCLKLLEVRLWYQSLEPLGDTT